MMSINKVSRHLLQNGSIGVIPTDTVYGVVARAEDSASVKRLYDLKKRDSKPGTLIAASTKQLEDLGLKHRYLKAVEQFWPGAVSVIIPVSDPNLSYLHQGKLSLAVRIPDDPNLRDLLKITGPLLTSSANDPGQPTAVSLEQAKAYFGEKVDFYDGDVDLSGRQPSTIIRILDDAIKVVRMGAVKIK
jgi:L-threonylcarbamoyladenylate synthase